MGFTFRIPFDIVQNGIDVDEEVLVLWDKDGERVWIKTTGPLSEAKRASIRGFSYATEADAYAAAERWQGVLVLGATRGRIGIDLLERRSFGEWSDEMLKLAQAALPPDLRVINDRAGILVFPDEVEPVFHTFNATGRSLQPRHYFLNQFVRSIDDASLNDRTMLAYGLFTSRSLMPRDASFLTLVSAIEALIEPQLLDPEELVLIDELVEMVTNSDLPEARRDSLRARVDKLRAESIGQAAGSSLVGSEIDGTTG